MANARPFLLVAAPAAIDAQFYHVVWFLRGRWADGPSFLFEFTHLLRWEENVSKIGHGTSSAMSPEEAIARAKELEPIAMTHVAAHEPQGLEIGIAVTISPDVNGGEQPVSG